MKKKLLAVNEVAAICGVAARTITRYRNMGYIPQPVSLCKRVRWRQDDIDQWIQAGCPDVRTTGWTPTTAETPSTTAQTEN